jgi:hypothetical protein
MTNERCSLFPPGTFVAGARLNLLLTIPGFQP